MQTLLSSHGGIDSEESLTAIIKQLKGTRERVRNECVNVFAKGYAPFVQVAEFLLAKQQASQSKSKVSLEMKFRDMDGPSLQKHIVLENGEYLEELFYLLRQFDSLGFPRQQQQQSSQQNENRLASPSVHSALSSASSTHTQLSTELTLPVRPGVVEKRPVSIVTELVTSVGERLKVLTPPENGRYLLLEQEKLSFLDERGEWRSVRLFLLTDVLIVAAKKSKLASLTATRKQYALERLVLLQDLKIINYQDNERIQNAWRLEHGVSYGIFQCDSADKKALLIQAIYDAKNALLGRSSSLKKDKKTSASKRAEPEAIEEKEYHVDQRTPAFTRKYLPNVLVQDVWSQLQGYLAELRGHVAVLDYELASVVMERLEEALSKAPDCPDALKIRLAYEQLRGNLKGKLLGKMVQLAGSSPLLSIQHRAVEEMVRGRLALEHMGFGEDAQDAFLEARLHLLHETTQQLRLGHGTLAFLQDYCHLSTCLLKETGAVFSKVFGANTGFLFWLRIQIKEMASTVARILLSRGNLGYVELEKGVKSSCAYAKEMSGNVGIDTGYEFQLAFEPFLSGYIQKCSREYLNLLSGKLDDGDFDVHEDFAGYHERLGELQKMLLNN